MTSHDILIVGGGFAGIYSAWRLAQDGHKVALIEASDHLGGTMWSREWHGYLVDAGTHNLDLRSRIGAAFYEDILGKDLGESDRNEYASTTGQTITRGFEMPDLSVDDPDLCRSALQELSEMKTAPERPDSSDLTGCIHSVYGEQLGSALCGFARKVIGAPLDGLAADAFSSLGMLSRPKLGTDEEMIALKQADPFFDARLGVTLNCTDPRFVGRNTQRRIGYPKTGSMRQFCISAEVRLRELGVHVLTQQRVSALEVSSDRIKVTTSGGAIAGARLFWTLPDHGLLDLLGADIDLKSAAHPVGSAFFTFEVDARSVASLDYIHDFNIHRRAYRYNRAGVYSGQIKADGKTFVMAEVPCHPAQLESLLTTDVAREIWRDMHDIGYLDGDATLGQHGCWGYPVAFTLPKVGWQSAIAATSQRIAEASPRLLTIEFGHRGRETFMRLYENRLQHELRI